jgi:O-antigen biosynthesis protein
MTSDLAFFDQPHHQALELLSARALARGDVPTAFRLSDRRCRIAPLPGPECYVLRGDALFRMGNRQAALADIARAIEIAPNDIVANRRMLAWCDGPHQNGAALVLIAGDHDAETLRQAIGVLRRTGKVAFATARHIGDTVRGWAAWPCDGAAELAIADECSVVTSILQPDPSHPLVGAVANAADFSLPVPPSDRAQLIVVSFEGETLASTWTSGKVPGSAAAQTRIDVASSIRMPRQLGNAVSDFPATVIVPVYADFEATKACIDSLLRQPLASMRFRIIVVNDASPDARICAYLVRVAQEHRIRLLTNERNLGFVGSVNRAMIEVADGDIVVLNADTIVPYRFIERLAASARSAPDIGTVTPLSNNGEFTSFPIPNRQNPLPTYQEIATIDRVAAEVNAGRIVDIPNGIGFCLYVTRACLNAVGFLSNDYHRGYLEDVDFCLRARELGFRNVCAPAVYVGHAGSRSFGAEKRSLVVRNLVIAERRFPQYRAECAAFVALDPLQASRQAIERASPPRLWKPYLLVTGEGAIAAVAGERARKLLSEGRSALVLTLCRRPAGMTVKVVAPSAVAPQSIAFDLTMPSESVALFEYLRAVKPCRIEYIDPAIVPPPLFDAFLGLGIAFDIVVATAGFLGNVGMSSLGATGRLRPCAQDGQHRAVGDLKARYAAAIHRDYLLQLREKADRLLAPGPQAVAFAGQHLPPRDMTRLEILELRHAADRQRETHSSPRYGLRHRLGMIPVGSCVNEQRLIRGIASRLKKLYPVASVVVMGRTLDDMGLMRFRDTFVTGSVDASELGHLCRAYELGSLFVSLTAPLFGHPLQSFAESSGLPVAFFDWSKGRYLPRPEDLLLDPLGSMDEVVEALVHWMGAN